MDKYKLNMLFNISSVFYQKYEKMPFFYAFSTSRLENHRKHSSVPNFSRIIFKHGKGIYRSKDLKEIIIYSQLNKSTKQFEHIKRNKHIFYIYQNMIGDPSIMRITALEGSSFIITVLMNQTNDKMIIELPICIDLYHHYQFIYTMYL